MGFEDDPKDEVQSYPCDCGGEITENDYGKCPACGNEAADKYCPNCDTKMSTWECDRCGLK